MKRLLALTSILFATHSVFSQEAFYVQNCNDISKVENSNPEQVSPIEWQVRLYKKGASKNGNSYWGTIKGSTANEVMTKLKSDQDFELRFNAFIGKGRVQDDVLTHFNPLGPIAIMEACTSKKSPNEENVTPTSEVYDKAKEYFSAYIEAKKRLDVILKGKAVNPYDNYGSVFREYTNNLKDAIKQIISLRTLLGNNASITMEKIDKQIASIDSKLETANTNQKQLNTAISENQNQNKTNNDVGLKNSTSNQLPLSNFPNKYKASIQTVLESGREISNIKASIPYELTAGMNEQQKVYFKDFVEQINYYWTDMAYCFGLMSEGSIGYGYLDNNKILIDVTDQYYRDNVFKNAQIFETSNYNTYYSQALLDKANAAYNLFKLIEHESNVTKQTKNNLLNYGLTNANMIYQEAIEGYRNKDVLTQKQEIISKIKQSLK
jgi:hypothetical protein